MNGKAAGENQYEVCRVRHTGSGAHTGYDIKQHMEQSTSYFWNENYGQIYPTLAELLDQRDIEVKIIRQKGKPDKKTLQYHRSRQADIIALAVSADGA
ncbi:hypothetical protein HMSSN036_82640 [Paenibacillus macerans]|nr:hypothetical protein HMSSN036_82640 [Paenibacillus macerans]